MRKPPSAKKLTEAVARWNGAHEVGAKVFVRLDSGEQRETVTRSPAEVLSGHSAVIWLEGISGCYLLDRVRPAIVIEHG